MSRLKVLTQYKKINIPLSTRESRRDESGERDRRDGGGRGARGARSVRAAEEDPGARTEGLAIRLNE